VDRAKFFREYIAADSSASAVPIVCDSEAVPRAIQAIQSPQNDLVWVRFADLEEYYNEKAKAAQSVSEAKGGGKLSSLDGDTDAVQILKRYDGYLSALHAALPPQSLMLLTTGSEPSHELHSIDDPVQKAAAIEKLRASMFYVIVK